MKTMLALALATAAAVASPQDQEDPPRQPIAPSAASIRVTVAIEFGIAARDRVERAIEVPEGSTVVDATREVAEVEQDRLCCSPDDVWSIAGVGPDVRRHAYWSWRLGEKSGPGLPSRYVLQDGDSVEWRYGGRTPESGRHRVVSLLPAATEIMAAIGAEDDLVAVSHLCPRSDDRDLPRVVSSTIDSDALSMLAIDAKVRAASARRESLYRLDEERIRALAPTIVLSQGVCPVCAVPPEQAESLDAIDGSGDPPRARLVVLSPRTLADVAKGIREVGAAIDRAGDAGVAARIFERSLEKVGAAAQASEGPRPTVAVVEWFDPLWVSGEWIAEMVEVAGGVPVLAAASESSRRVEVSDLAAADPDVIVLAPCSMSVERAERELAALAARPEWNELRAVRAGRVFLMDGAAHFSSPGPGLARGVELLGAILADLDGAVPKVPADWKRISPP